MATVLHQNRGCGHGEDTDVPVAAPAGGVSSQEGEDAENEFPVEADGEVSLAELATSRVIADRLDRPVTQNASLGEEIIAGRFRDYAGSVQVSVQFRCGFREGSGRFRKVPGGFGAVLVLVPGGSGWFREVPEASIVGSNWFREVSVRFRCWCRKVPKCCGAVPVLVPGGFRKKLV
eukprot:s1495_g8.t1